MTEEVIEKVKKFYLYGFALEHVSDELQTDPEILGGVDIDFLKKRGFS
tara:strand:+ start:196 stop:339 length:144 start_codon:yes stop_codon:yes gene_type:complete